MEIDRNTIEGFARRVHKNLAYMIDARARGQDVHLVTHLTCSLLGLIVFPYEHVRRARFPNFASQTMSELSAAGWPLWTFSIGMSETLNNHLWHLRNALSHRRIRFSSDSRDLAEVEVTFWDRPRPDAPDNWSAAIDGLGLLLFVGQLSDLIDRAS